MNSRNRRDFLKLCLTAVPALVVANNVAAEQAKSSSTAQPAYRTPATIDRYIDPLPVPKRLTSTGTRKDVVQYRIGMTEFKQQMHSQLPPTRLWGYEGQYPGPTIEAYRGSPTEIAWENHLPTQHIFDVDPHMRGAAPPTPTVRTVPHLNGARSRPESDGLPDKWFTPGNAGLYSYLNSQPSATLWYHDHAIGIARLNVYAGLAGLFLLRDDEERSMNLPSGEFEIPLILQDRNLDEKGQLLYSPTWEDGSKTPPGVWGPELYADLPVVNGAIYPYLNVAPCAYRLRVLNAANSRFFNLFLNLSKRPTDIPSLVTFHQIGTDGGFLPTSATLSKLLIAPGERADLIVDFSNLEGKIVTLSNNAAAPFPGWQMSDPHYEQLYELMQFRVTLAAPSPKRNFSMTASSSFQKLAETPSTITRDFVISEQMNQGWSLGMQINNKGYEDAVTEVVKLNSIEKWRFINTTEDAHPVHLHLVQFQIIQRQGFNPSAMQKGRLELVGTPRLPAPNEVGWKDTAVVSPRDVLTIIVKFEGYPGRYVFNCQMLEHQDNDMMRPYEVVADASINPPS
jgi:spore coat protein A